MPRCCLVRLQAPQPTTPARDAMASLETDEATAAIVDLMLRHEWEAGRSHLEFARRYGVKVETVRNWAGDASRFIRLCHGSQDEIRDELLQSIRQVGREARQAGDYRSANGSLELACKVHGLLEQKQRPDEGTESVPVEQLAAALRALGHEVKLNDRTIAASVGAVGGADAIAGRGSEAESAESADKG